MKKEEVIKYLDAQGMTQKELAVKLKISQPAISKWPEQVPELQAMKLQKISNGVLEYKESNYQPYQAA